jgi:hypothetical protein
MSFTPTLFIASLRSLASPLLPNKHPLDSIYAPEILDSVGHVIPFVEMFCFPAEVKMKEKGERERWHAFVSTLQKRKKSPMDRENG